MGIKWIFQSMLWSPILRIFSETINKNLRHKAILNISLSLPIGTICAYLVSTVIIKFYEWKIIFVCGGICIFVASVFVILAVFYVKAYITKVKIQNSDKKINQIVPMAKQTYYLWQCAAVFL